MERQQCKFSIGGIERILGPDRGLRANRATHGDVNTPMHVTKDERGSCENFGRLGRTVWSAAPVKGQMSTDRKTERQTHPRQIVSRLVLGIAFKFTDATTVPEQSKVPQKMCAKEEHNL